MAEGFDALTEKEKETLRLMVRGHDAKSMARELSLSVHTINDRLRSARRKLGVTSSREAARLVLEQESDPPENLAYKELGSASEGRQEETVGEAQGRTVRRKNLGVFLMMTLFAAGLILTSQLVQTDEQARSAAVESTDAVVSTAARDWLALTDSGDWQGSFDAAGSTFREVNTVEGWTNAARQVREPLGAVVKREVLSVRYLNAPPHGFQEVAFSSLYENREHPLIETVTLQKEDGKWKVVGILVD